jgi:phosphatidylglycerophosphate synthase
VSYLTLTLITASRLVVCAPLWLWCWWKRPRWMVLWMSLVAAWFLVTDHLDGQWALRYGLVSELGYWLDHVGDFVFYGAVVLTTIRGSRERSLRRRRSATAPRATCAVTPPAPKGPPTPA